VQQAIADLGIDAEKKNPAMRKAAGISRANALRTELTANPSCVLNEGRQWLISSFPNWVERRGRRCRPLLVKAGDQLKKDSAGPRARDGQGDDRSPVERRWRRQGRQGQAGRQGQGRPAGADGRRSPPPPQPAAADKPGGQAARRGARTARHDRESLTADAKTRPGRPQRRATSAPSKVVDINRGTRPQPLRAGSASGVQRRGAGPPRASTRRYARELGVDITASRAAVLAAACRWTT
jgi:hypothetical protein